MDVHWEPCLNISLQPVTASDLAQLEHDWGVKLPEEYKSLVSAYQGMTPEPAVFNVGRGTDVFNVLLTLKSYKGRESYSVERAYELLKPLVPAGLFPFATTAGGEFLCFDYRTSSDQPQIVFVTVETFIYPIAASLRNFLNQLHN